MPDDSEWVTLAELLRARGNRGEIAANSLTSGADRFLALEKVWVFDSTGKLSGEYSVEEAWEHRGQLILKFHGIDDIEGAEALRGAEVKIPRELRAPLPDGEYYFSDLVGCKVIDADTEESYGTVSAVDDNAGIRLEVGAMLIPFVHQICVEIAPERSVIRVRLPEGFAAIYK